MNDLSTLRAEIDRIDTELAQLFAERMACAVRVAEAKRGQPLAIRQPNREDEILQKRAAQVGEYGTRAKVLFSTLMDLSRSRQYAQIGTCPEALRGATAVSFSIPRKSDELRRALTQVAALGLTVETLSAVPSAENPECTAVTVHLTPPQTAAEAEAMQTLLCALQAEYGARRLSE